MVPDFLTLSGSESWLRSWEKVQLSISIMSLSLGLMWMVYSSSSKTHIGTVLCLQTYSRLALCSLLFKCMLHLDLLFMVHFTYVRFYVRLVSWLQPLPLHHQPVSFLLPLCACPSLHCILNLHFQGVFCHTTAIFLYATSLCQGHKHQIIHSLAMCQYHLHENCTIEG